MPVIENFVPIPCHMHIVATFFILKIKAVNIYINKLQEF